MNPITSNILFDETTVINLKRRKITFKALEPEETPKEGDIIGLDAEFVSLNQVRVCGVWIEKSTVMCLSNGTPKIINFPFVPNRKLFIF